MNKKSSKTSEVKHVVELVMKNNQPMVSSLVVAELFEKRHDNVLQSINDLDVPDDFRRLNFQESSYINKQNKEQPSFNMTRDGFSLLAMGFTGKKAMEWKIKFLEAFNAMEAKLKCPPVELKIPLIKADSGEIRCFEGFARYWSYLSGLSWEDGKKQIEAAVNVPDLSNVSRLSLKNAWVYVLECVAVVPRSFANIDPCSEHDLSPVIGLLDYWAYNHRSSREELEAGLCERMRIDALELLPKSYLPHAISLIWKAISYEKGMRSAQQEENH